MLPPYRPFRDKPADDAARSKPVSRREPRKAAPAIPPERKPLKPELVVVSRRRRAAQRFLEVDAEAGS